MARAFETHHDRSAELDLHRHRSAYLALVLEGTYEERSVDGRYRLEPGMIVYHPPWHAHRNRFLCDGVRVLNAEITVAPGSSDQPPSYLCMAARGDAAQLENVMREKPLEAASAAREIFLAQKSARPEPAPHWVKTLARKLSCTLSIEDNPEPIQHLVRALGVSPEHASRKFSAEFGISPTTFRAEHRLRRALEALALSAPLAAAAAEAGYADQSHMGRAFKKALGETPRQVRDKRSNPF